ncbi:MAG: hypothetical protein Q8M35_07860, partial [Pseudohongiella sp.]|nr:hypothetical protein [Pseudohongiella sp.]
MLVLRHLKNIVESEEFMSNLSRLTNAVTRAPAGLIAGVGITGVLLAMTAIAADNTAPQASATMSELMTRIV